jgi:hypothetical protein
VADEIRAVLELLQLGTACDGCGHFACVCAIRTRHKRDCQFRVAAAGIVGITCRHGHDCCAQCDPCTCGATVTAEDTAAWRLWRALGGEDG